MSSNSLLGRRLYRALLKAAQPFTVASSEKAIVLNCLLHRSGVGDDSWDQFLRKRADDDVSSDDEESGSDSDGREEYDLFRKLLREIMAGEKEGIRLMQFPCHVVGDPQNSERLRRVVQREFKNLPGSISSSYDPATRRQTAFLGLREMNKKLAWMDRLANMASKRPRHPGQAARYVSPVPMHPPSSYLRSGTYLIAHPQMTGYFRRTVICILNHKEDGEQEEEATENSGKYGTYGLIVNKVFTSPSNGNNLTLEEILRPVPPSLLAAFGKSVVKDGGPVRLSLQMLRSSPKDNEELDIGGKIVPNILGNQSDYVEGEIDQKIYYNGDVQKLADAVLSGELDRGDVSFFIGASCWMPGQLESEIERGFWIPCRGPLGIARSGTCDHDIATDVCDSYIREDLWLSMLSACGEEEANLAHLLVDEDGTDALGRCCDDFD